MTAAVTRTAAAATGALQQSLALAAAALKLQRAQQRQGRSGGRPGWSAQWAAAWCAWRRLRARRTCRSASSRAAAGRRWMAVRAWPVPLLEVGLVQPLYRSRQGGCARRL